MSVSILRRAGALALTLGLVTGQAGAATHHRHHGRSGHHALARAQARATKTAVAASAPKPVVASAPNPRPISAPSAASALAAAVVWYDFKGARLGMSLADWKAMAPVAAGAAAECSDAAGSRMFLSDAEKGAGIVRCQYSAAGATAPIPLGSRFTSRDYTFAFLEGRLFRIVLRAPLEARDDVAPGLEARWGKPSSQAQDTTQTEAGGTLVHQVSTWLNPAAAIVLETPADRLDELSVTYLDRAAERSLEEAPQKAPAQSASVM